MAKRSGKFSEKNLCTEIIKSIEAAGGWAYKIPDAAVSYTKADAGKTRFNLPRALDIVACIGGHFVGIEAKLQRGGGNVRLTALRDVQQEALEAIEAAGGKAFVAVGWRFKAGPLQEKRFGQAHVRELYLIPWRDWQRLGESEREITREQMEPWGIEWLGHGLWKVRTVLKAAPGGESTSARYRC